MCRKFWQPVRLGDLGNVITGRTPPSSRPECFGNTYKFITPSDMDGRKRITSTQRYISDEGAALLKSNRLPANCVAVSCIGWQMGKVAMTVDECFTNQQLNTIVPDRTVIDPDFLYYSLIPRQQELKNLGSGGTRTPILNKSRFSDLEVLLPPLETQRQIAGILSAYDDLIENNTRRIRILEEMAQALYREWFVHFRYPGHEHVPLVESSAGPIPEGWEVVSLSEVAEVNARSIRKGDSLDEIYYVDISSVSPGRVNNIERMSFDAAPGRARRVIRHGDILWSTVRPNRRSYALVLEPPENLIASTGFAVVSARALPFTYVYGALSTNAFADYLTSHATGSAYPAVNTGIVERAVVLKPRTLVVDMFDQISAPLLTHTAKLLQKNELLILARDLLVSKLLSRTQRRKWTAGVVNGKA